MKSQTQKKTAYFYKNPAFITAIVFFNDGKRPRKYRNLKSETFDRFILFLNSDCPAYTHINLYRQFSKQFIEQIKNPKK
jgi:hypothetical protein